MARMASAICGPWRGTVQQPGRGSIESWSTPSRGEHVAGVIALCPGPQPVAKTPGPLVRPTGEHCRSQTERAEPRPTGSRMGLPYEATSTHPGTPVKLSALTIASLLSIILLPFHIGGDVALGFDRGGSGLVFVVVPI